MMWRLEGDRATVTTDILSAAVSFRQPAHGIHDVQLRSQPIDGATLLRVQGGGFAEPGNQPTDDRYTRGADLYAAYPANQLRSVRYEVYWRPLECSKTAGIELIVSARTEFLDSNPRIQIGGAMPCETMLCAVNKPAWHWEPVTEGSARELPRDASQGLLLFRLPHSELSYAEMIHPADFSGATATFAARQGTAAFSVFDQRLEKGVILRARLRGIFLDRGNDEQAALEHYRRFSESELPLAT